LPITASTPWEGYGGQTTTPIGMWHQFGTIPDAKSNQGIFLEVGDIPQEWLTYRAVKGDITSDYNGGAVQSLASVVGFDKNTSSEKIGKLAEGKTIFEAVVAIPFVDVQSITKTRKMILQPNQETRNFFELPTVTNLKEEISKIMVNDSSDISQIFPEGTSLSVIEMATKIKDRYVLPPQFDFFRNPNSKPIAMYIFDFEHTFDKNDLSCIWQNIAPKLGNQFAESIATISHPLLTENNLLEDLKDKVKWMVFKVKQRAPTKYSNLLISGKEREGLFSYNWPYDYFSMIEFAKMDASITYGSIEEATVATKSPKTKTGRPPLPPEDISVGNTSTTSESKQSQLRTDSIVQSNIKTLEREE